jgi:WD40-like Beta Propeller Repeat
MMGHPEQGISDTAREILLFDGATKGHKVSRCLLCFVVLGILVGLAGCNGGGGSTGGQQPSQGPAPIITSISPTNVTAGGPALAVTVNGSNFDSTASVNWRNSGNPGFGDGLTSFVSASKLTFQVAASDLAIPGTVQVDVINGDAGLSNTVTFAINPGPAGSAQVISPGANGATPNGGSHDPVLSFNGRFVAFSSEATNLISPNATFPQGYMRDTCIGAGSCTPATLLVSAITGGTPASPLEGNALGGAIPSIGSQFFSPPLPGGLPPAGRFIGFLSAATNVVTPNTTFQQAYVRDTCFGPISLTTCIPSTTLASGTESGGEPNGAASGFAFASNVCIAAFVSAGTNLISGVTLPNQIYLTSCPGNGPSDGLGTFMTSALVSADNSGAPGDQGAQQPSISSDGRWVAFASMSTNLTSTPNGGMQQIYVRDTCTFASAGCVPSTTFVSFDGSGSPFTGDSLLPAISDDGRFVVFTTQVPASGGGVTINVSIRDTCNSSNGPVTNCTPSTTTVSTAVGGGSGNGPSVSSPHAISGDGRFVAFSSSATNLVSPATAGNQVFVRDTCQSSSGSVSGCTPTTVLVSVNKTGPTGGFNAAISDDGHSVAYETSLPGVSQILRAATGF